MRIEVRSDNVYTSASVRKAVTYVPICLLTLKRLLDKRLESSSLRNVCLGQLGKAIFQIDFYLPLTQHDKDMSTSEAPVTVQVASSIYPPSGGSEAFI